MSYLFQNRIKSNTWTHSDIYRSLYFSGQKLVITNQPLPSKNECICLPSHKWPVKTFYYWGGGNPSSTPNLLRNLKFLPSCHSSCSSNLIHTTQFTFKNISVSWNCQIYWECSENIKTKYFLHKNSEPETYIISICLRVEIMAKIWN